MAKESFYLLIKVSHLLLTHAFFGETTSGMQTLDKVIYRLGERE